MPPSPAASFKGVFKVSDRPGQNVLRPDEEVFNGYVTEDLRVEIVAAGEDPLGPDAAAGKYTRLFRDGAGNLIVDHGPDAERLDPEVMVARRAGSARRIGDEPARRVQKFCRPRYTGPTSESAGEAMKNRDRNRPQAGGGDDEHFFPPAEFVRRPSVENTRRQIRLG
ncbi:MAG TPA: hypothetical protein VF586_18845 [Pyrinomonadaceae bacterium]|jgi:hypothetical protein